MKYNLSNIILYVRKNWFIFAILLISVAGTLLRLECARELSIIDSAVMNPSPGFDMETYHTLSSQIVSSGYGSLDFFYYQPFYYAVFLAVIKLLFGIDNIAMIIVFQAMLSGAAIFLSAVSARLLWNSAAGLIAAILMCLSGLLTAYPSYMLIETLQSFFMSLILLLCIAAYKKQMTVYFALLGFVLGCSLASRGNMLIIAAGLTAFFLVNFIIKKIKYRNHSFLRSLLKLMLLLFFMILPLLPFSIKNSIYLARFSGPSTAGNTVFLLGNVPDAMPGQVNYTYLFKKWQSQGEKEWHGYFLDYVKNNKLSYLDFMLNKALGFWDFRELPDNIDIVKVSNMAFVLKYVSSIPTPIIIVLGLSGILASLAFLKKSPILYIPLIITAGYWISIIIFYNLSRFRVALMPVLCIYSGLYASHFFECLRKVRILASSILSLVLLLSVFAVYFLYNIYSVYFEPFISRHIRPHGLKVQSGNEILYRDSASYLYINAFDILSIKQGLHITKKFITDKPESNNSYTLRILIAGQAGTFIIFDINGSQKTVMLDCPHRSYTIDKIPIQFDNNSTQAAVNIKAIYVDGPAFFSIDKQRNYGRTKLNNKRIDGELNMALIQTSD